MTAKQESAHSLGQYEGLKNCAGVGSACERIRDGLYKEFQDDKFPLVLGGDHGIAIGMNIYMSTLVNEYALIYY